MITSPLSSLLSGAVGSGAAALINPAARSVVIDGSSYLYESPALLPTVIKGKDGWSGWSSWSEATAKATYRLPM